MKKYNSLDINIINKDKIKDIILNNYSIKDNSQVLIVKKNIQKEIQKLLNFDINFREFVVALLNVNTQSLVHTDGERNFGLIFPITECTDVYFNWWKPLPSYKESVKTVNFDNNIIDIVDRNYSKLTDSIKIVKPTIVSVNEFHSVQNKSDKFHEILLSIRLPKEFDTTIDIYTNKILETIT